MRLLIGGVGQGKLDYALRTCGGSAPRVAHTLEEARSAAILANLERIIWEGLRREADWETELEQLLAENPAITLICCEVGCGVVPMDPEERRWRETVGRTCCRLARRAERVERVFCGLAMTLKG